MSSKLAALDSPSASMDPYRAISLDSKLSVLPDKEKADPKPEKRPEPLGAEIAEVNPPFRL